METIPPFRDRVFGEGVVAQMPNRVSDDNFAVYTRFENEGVNNNGHYSLISGPQVAGDLGNA